MARTGVKPSAQSAPSRLWRVRDKDLAKATSELFRTPFDIWASVIQHRPEFVTGSVLDPSAGNGDLIALITGAGYLADHKIYDIREAEMVTWRSRCLYMVTDAEIANFMDARQDRWFDNAMTNPPFTIATDFVEKMLTWVRPGGHVTVLQATNWLSGQERCAWFQTVPFFEQIVIPWRPTFTIEKPDDLYSPFQFAYGFSLYTFKRGYEGKASISFLPELHA